MKWFLQSLAISFALLGLSSALYAQTPDFNVNSYKQFLSENQNLSTEKLLGLHPAGLFQGNFKFNHFSYLYSDLIGERYNLTPGEMSILDKNGFMVTERLQFPNFQSAFEDIFYKDLPVMVTSDAILHAFHMSYDKILTDMELQILIPELTDFLKSLHGQIPALAANYSIEAGMKVPLKDLDIYLTVARALLEGQASPVFAENTSEITSILQNIASEKMSEIKLFSSTTKTMDFSQFKPRGHYVSKEHPELANYFKAMIWLGRTEIYLLAPRALHPAPSAEDLQRQAIDAMLVLEAVQNSGTFNSYEKINGIIQFFTGEQDNVTLPNLKSLSESVKLAKASGLLDQSKLKTFQDSLKTKAYAFQRILSQIITTDVTSPDSIIPASAFLLFGQRFVLDSYVTAQVVFDRITYGSERPKRMLPSTLDVLYALGNDASVQLLQKDLDKYHYGPNLAALRYLVDSYGQDFWDLSLYNGWLNAIRKLNPKQDRKNLPLAMQTAAWWQEKMNTQLASWAQLRHDNLLYAKQSYSGAVSCSYPYGYVEPVPEFFLELKKFSEKAEAYFSGLNYKDESMKTNIKDYFSGTKSIYERLASMAQKELDKVPFSQEDTSFINKLATIRGACGDSKPGWYSNLFYESMGFPGRDCEYVVADIHTAPTDELGNPVGWVKHAGTGPVNMGVFLIETPSAENVAFVGPVLSYYELTTTNFQRLTDDDWAQTYLSSSAVRPEFVNIYLADNTGNERPAGISLLSSIDNEKEKQIPQTMVLAQNYPNPFNSHTTIRFAIPHNMTNRQVRLKIYNALGVEVKDLFNHMLPAGNYVTRWDGTDASGQNVSSGVYFYNLTIESDGGSEKLSGKMMLLK
ncbi:MAG: DUF3160 domain-containing protein [Acidobacteriota bacterium]